MRTLFLALAFCFGVGPALADSLVVQTCGTLPLAYKAGSSRLDTVDVNGVKCTGAGGGGGLSVVDSAAWTTSVSPFTPSGGVFNDAATLSTGTQGTFRLTTKRAQIIDTDTTGNALYSAVTAATPAGANTIGNVKIVDTAGTNLATVKAASTAPVATDTSFVTALNPNSPGIIATGGSTTALSVPINLNSQYPVNSVTTAPTAITGNSTGSTGAVVGTLAAAASKTTFICGFNVSTIGGTAPSSPITVAGLIGSSQVYQTPINAAAGQILITQNFNPCIPASAVNTAITITTTAAAAATAVDVNSWGYQL